MKQKLLNSIKLRVAMLVAVLCAVANGTAWATPTTKISFSRSSSINTYTTGYTFTAEAESKSGYYQDGSGTVRSLTLYHTSTKLFTSTPGTVTFAATLGGGTTKDPLTNSVYVCYVDKTGKDIDGSAVVVTTKITSTTGSSFSATMSTALATDAYGVKIYHTKEPSYNVRYYSFSLSYEEPAYTVTAVSNNVSYGTVSGTTTITAAPETGYRVASGSDGYTVTSGTATVSHVGYSNTLNVTPTSNCTVRVNFEAIPTHTISCVADPVGAGTFDAVSSLYEGGTTDITAAAKSGYKFKSWSVSGTGASISSTTDNPTTLTMGTANVTLTATFDEVTTHAITYSVNGNETIVNVAEGDALDFSAPASGVPMGYTFKGWRTSTLALTDTDPNDYVTSGTSSADITYYAVFAVDTKTPTTTHLTGDEIASNFAATAMGYADSEATYSDTSEGMTWGARCITNATRHWIQLKSDNDVYIKAVAPQNITGVKVKISNTTNEKGGIDDISKHGAFSGTVNLDKVQDTNSGACGSAASSAIVDNYLTISANGTSKTIYIHVTGAARIWSVDVTYNTISTSHYCTTVSDVPVTVSSASYATFVSDLPLDFNDASINAYIAKANGTTGVTFTRIYKVPANTGVLLYKDKGATEYVPVLDGAADDVDGNVFKAGTGAAVASVSGSNHNYILNNVGGVVGFYRANGQTVAANRAYIQITEAAAKGFIELPAFDDATAIESVQGSEFRVQDSAIYNLAGQRMSRLQKGVNIVNGKKVLVK